MKTRRGLSLAGLVCLGGLALGAPVWAQAQAPAAARATIREYKKTIRTYPFSDPDPIAAPGRIYPYYRFDGYTDRAVDKPWTVVELENRFLKVSRPAGDRREDLVGGREVHRPLLHLRQPGGEVQGHRPARALDERRHRAELRHHRPHPQLRDTRGLPRRASSRTAAPPSSSACSTCSRGRRGGWKCRCRPTRPYFTTRSFWYNATPLEQPVLHLDERGHQGGREPAADLPGHPPPRPRRRGGPLARQPREREGPLVLRAERLRALQVVSRVRPPLRLLRRLLARRRLRHGPIRHPGRQAREEGVDLGPLAAGDDLGEAAHRRRRSIRGGAVGAALQPGGREQHGNTVQAPRVRALRLGQLDRILVPGPRDQGVREGERDGGPQRHRGVGHPPPPPLAAAADRGRHRSGGPGTRGLPREAGAGAHAGLVEEHSLGLAGRSRARADRGRLQVRRRRRRRPRSPGGAAEGLRLGLGLRPLAPGQGVDPAAGVRPRAGVARGLPAQGRELRAGADGPRDAALPCAWTPPAPGTLRGTLSASTPTIPPRTTTTRWRRGASARTWTRRTASRWPPLPPSTATAAWTELAKLHLAEGNLALARQYAARSLETNGRISMAITWRRSWRACAASRRRPKPPFPGRWPSIRSNHLARFERYLLAGGAARRRSSEGSIARAAARDLPGGGGLVSGGGPASGRGARARDRATYRRDALLAGVPAVAPERGVGPGHAAARGGCHAGPRLPVPARRAPTPWSGRWSRPEGGAPVTTWRC